MQNDQPFFFNLKGKIRQQAYFSTRTVCGNRISIFFLSLAFLAALAAPVDCEELLSVPQDKVDGCINNSKNSGDAISCVNRIVNVCYNQSSHTDIERAECTNSAIDQLRSTNKKIVGQLSARSSEWMQLANAARLASEQYRNSLCSWSTITYSGGTLGDDLSSACYLAIQSMTAYELSEALNTPSEH